jgi:hypothetical protein
MVSCMRFYRFLKNSNFRSTSLGVSLRFYQKFPLCGEDKPKLCISMLWPPYSSSVVAIGPVYEILWVLKKIKFRSKSIGVSLRFYRKFPVCGENVPKLCISWLWLSYSRSVVPNGYVYEILWVLKKSNFCSKSIGVSLRFYRNSQFAVKTDRNSIFRGRDSHIPDW